MNIVICMREHPGRLPIRGSQRRECSKCQAFVMISPATRSQADQHGPWEAACMECASRLAGGLKVSSLSIDGEAEVVKHLSSREGN